MRFFASGFFHESSSLKHLKIAWGSFQIFSKILWDIRKSRCSTGINDTGGKFGNSIRLLHFKVNLKEKNYLYNNSTTQRLKKIILIFWLKLFPFATGVNNTGGAPWAANISKNFRKNLKRPRWRTQGLGGNWFMKKTSSRKSRGTVPLNPLKIWHVTQ